MPTYQYECQACGKHFEAFQKMSDDPLSQCPDCAGPVSRLIGTGAGVIFKGSGFYATDYAGSSSVFAPQCGRERPCCGRDTPCGTRSCDD